MSFFCCPKTSNKDTQELWCMSRSLEWSQAQKTNTSAIYDLESQTTAKQANPSYQDDRGFSAKTNMAKHDSGDSESLKVWSEKKKSFLQEDNFSEKINPSVKTYNFSNNGLNSMESDLVVPASAAKKTASLLPRLFDRRSFLVQRKVRKRKPALTDSREPIPISWLGELSHSKPLKLLSCNIPCSLRITDKYFELFWAQANSVCSASAQTNSSRKTKKSIQGSYHMVWISGSVTPEAKALILYPSKLIVSICGVEQGLARGIGGMLRIWPSSDQSQRTGNDGPRSSILSNTSNFSIETLTPSWFACEGFLLETTYEDEKRFLSEFFIKDIVDILWEFLPEFKFKDRAQLSMSTEHQDSSRLEEDETLLKPFRLVPLSKTELMLSNIDLEAYVHSNVDARFSSINLSKLNGRFICPDRLPAHLRKKLISKFLHQKDQISKKPRIERLSDSISNITLCGDKDHDSNVIKGVAFKHSLSKGNNLCYNWDALKVPSDQNSPRSGDIDRHLNVSELGKHPSFTSVIPDLSASNSFSVFTLSNIPNSLSFSPNSPEILKLTEIAGMPVVTACPKRKDSLQLQTLPLQLLTDLIYDFEEQIMDAVLTALTSEENQCFFVTKPDRNYYSKNEVITSGKCDRNDIQTMHLLRPPVKTEERLKGMVLLLRPERTSRGNSDEVTIINFSKDLEDTDDRKSNDYVRKSKLFVESLLPPDLGFSHTASTDQSSVVYDDSYIPYRNNSV